MEIRLNNPDKAASYLWRMRWLAKSVVDPLIVRAYENPGQRQRVPESNWTIRCDEGTYIIDRD
jgi:hypothetical protein